MNFFKPFFSKLTVDKVTGLDLARKSNELCNNNIPKDYNCRTFYYYEDNDMCFKCFKFECSEWVATLEGQECRSVWKSFLYDHVATPPYLHLATKYKTVILSPIDGKPILQTDKLSVCQYCPQHSEDSDGEYMYDNELNPVNDDEANSSLNDCWSSTDEDENYEPAVKRKRKSKPLRTTEALITNEEGNWDEEM